MVKYDEVVNLGRCCEVVFAIRKMALSSTTYPFDWSLSTFNGIIDLLYDDFKSVDSLCKSTHPLYQDQIMDRFGEIEVWLPHLDVTIQSIYTDSTGTHHPEYCESLERLYKKIKRFRILMKSGAHVLFIIKNHVFQELDAASAQRLVDAIKDVSNISFNILVINEYTTEPKEDIYPAECIVKNIIRDHIQTARDDKMLVCCNLPDHELDTIWKPFIQDIHT